jgi:hypothetical protein
VQGATIGNMPLIKIVPRDILETRATETLRQIARYDACDLCSEFEPERFSHLAELSAIGKEAEVLGLAEVLRVRGVSRGNLRERARGAVP